LGGSRSNREREDQEEIADSIEREEAHTTTRTKEPEVLTSELTFESSSSSSQNLLYDVVIHDSSTTSTCTHDINNIKENCAKYVNDNTDELIVDQYLQPLIVSGLEQDSHVTTTTSSDVEVQTIIHGEKAIIHGVAYDVNRSSTIRSSNDHVSYVAQNHVNSSTLNSGCYTAGSSCCNSAKDHSGGSSSGCSSTTTTATNLSVYFNNSYAGAISNRISTAANSSYNNSHHSSSSINYGSTSDSHNSSRLTSPVLLSSNFNSNNSSSSSYNNNTIAGTGNTTIAGGNTIVTSCSTCGKNCCSVNCNNYNPSMGCGCGKHAPQTVKRISHGEDTVPPPRPFLIEEDTLGSIFCVFEVCVTIMMK